MPFEFDIALPALTQQQPDLGSEFPQAAEQHDAPQQQEHTQCNRAEIVERQFGLHFFLLSVSSSCAARGGIPKR